jgi:hypothetical protein
MMTIRNARRIAGAITLAALLGACAGPAPVWRKEGASTQDFQADKYACLKDATALGGAAYIGFGVTKRMPDWALYHDCMAAHGWRNIAGIEQPITPVGGWR